MLEVDHGLVPTPKRPKASIEYNSQGKFYIFCKEPSCTFFGNNSCLNTNALINDDCMYDQYCASGYESRDPYDINPLPSND